MNNNIYGLDLLLDLIEIESAKLIRPRKDDVKTEKLKHSTKTFVSLDNDNEYGKPAGEYITYELKSDFVGSGEVIGEMAQDFERLFKGKKNILFVGVGNQSIVSDSLGPSVISKLDSPANYKTKVSKISPNVEGNTGIESSDLVRLAIDLVKPDLVVVIDSLASRNFNRVGKSFQISTGGIVPGSGSGKKGLFEFSKDTLGVPVVAVGVPIVVHFKSYLFELVSLMKLKEECSCLAYEYIGTEDSLRSVILAPKEVDVIVDFASTVIANAINCMLTK